MVFKTPVIDSTPGLIAPDVLYTLSELKKRTRLGDWAMRKARKAGLRVHKVGNTRFVFGKDFHQFIENAGTEAA